MYKQLELRSHESNHEDEEADTEINEDKKKEEFLEKRKSAYKNEFTLARKFSVNCEDKEEEECRNETLKNTLFNKFSGKLHKEQDEQ